MKSFVLPGFAVTRLGAAASAAIVALAVSAPVTALAAFCGDDVGGLRVPCSCGDDVVSDTRLSVTDPVVSQPCTGDGLVVFAPSDSDGITLNLGGHSLLGSSSGVGIRVVRGGRLGSIIVGGDADDPRAEIANFRTGITASGRSALRELRGVDVHHNVGDGLRIHSSGVLVEDVRSSDNGRDGVSVFGHGVDVSGVVAEGNRSDGLQVRGAGATVSAQTSNNRRHGTVIAGRGNTVRELQSDGNGGVGLSTTGSGHEVGAFHAEGNALGVTKDRAEATTTGVGR